MTDDMKQPHNPEFDRAQQLELKELARVLDKAERDTRVEAWKARYEHAVAHLDTWIDSNEESFASNLFDLIALATPSQKVRLAAAFPIEVQVYCDWSESEDGEKFFESFKK